MSIVLDETSRKVVNATLAFKPDVAALYPTMMGFRSNAGITVCHWFDSRNFGIEPGCDGVSFDKTVMGMASRSSGDVIIDLDAGEATVDGMHVRFGKAPADVDVVSVSDGFTVNGRVVADALATAAKFASHRANTFGVRVEVKKGNLFVSATERHFAYRSHTGQLIENHEGSPVILTPRVAVAASRVLPLAPTWYMTLGDDKIKVWSDQTAVLLHGCYLSSPDLDKLQRGERKVLASIRTGEWLDRLNFVSGASGGSVPVLVEAEMTGEHVSVDFECRFDFTSSVESATFTANADVKEPFSMYVSLKLLIACLASVGEVADIVCYSESSSNVLSFVGENETYIAQMERRDETKIGQVSH